MSVMCECILGHLYHHSPYLYMERIQKSMYHFSHRRNMHEKFNMFVYLLVFFPFRFYCQFSRVLGTVFKEKLWPEITH